LPDVRGAELLAGRAECPPPRQQPAVEETNVNRPFLTRVALSFLPMVAAALMSSVPLLCYRTGPFRACSQSVSGYQATISCPNPNGEPWTCPSGAPSENDVVERCAKVAAGEIGKTVCNNLDTSGRCSWRKAKCGPNAGDCDLEFLTTSNTVPNQTVAGNNCTGQVSVPGSQQ
jgi:hypothetical protein